MGVISGIIILFLTLFLPPVGVFAVAGCGLDLVINIALTILGFLPGTIHALYVLYVYYDRRDQAKRGAPVPERAPFIFSHRVQSGGYRGYGTLH